MTYYIKYEPEFKLFGESSLKHEGKTSLNTRVAELDLVRSVTVHETIVISGLGLDMSDLDAEATSDEDVEILVIAVLTVLVDGPGAGAAETYRIQDGTAGRGVYLQFGRKTEIESGACKYENLGSAEVEIVAGHHRNSDVVLGRRTFNRGGSQAGKSGGRSILGRMESIAQGRSKRKGAGHGNIDRSFNIEPGGLSLRRTVIRNGGRIVHGITGAD